HALEHGRGEGDGIGVEGTRTIGQRQRGDAIVVTHRIRKNQDAIARRRIVWRRRDHFDGDGPLAAREASAEPIGQAAGRRSTRTAQTLYSGIFELGSKAALVRKFAAESASFTNGTNTAPGRTASV